ncbi:hypothetical protein ACT4S2_07670 [Kocuria turfanensis]
MRRLFAVTRAAAAVVAAAPAVVVAVVAGAVVAIPRRGRAPARPLPS